MNLSGNQPRWIESCSWVCTVLWSGILFLIDLTNFTIYKRINFFFLLLDSVWNLNAKEWVAAKTRPSIWILFLLWVHLGLLISCWKISQMISFLISNKHSSKSTAIIEVFLLLLWKIFLLFLQQINLNHFVCVHAIPNYLFIIVFSHLSKWTVLRQLHR